MTRAPSLDRIPADRLGKPFPELELPTMLHPADESELR
jgi:hypothetical protein